MNAIVYSDELGTRWDIVDIPAELAGLARSIAAVSLRASQITTPSWRRTLRATRSRRPSAEAYVRPLWISP